MLASGEPGGFCSCVALWSLCHGAGDCLTATSQRQRDVSYLNASSSVLLPGLLFSAAGFPRPPLSIPTMRLFFFSPLASVPERWLVSTKYSPSYIYTGVVLPRIVQLARCAARRVVGSSPAPHLCRQGRAAFAWDMRQSVAAPATFISRCVHEPASTQARFSPKNAIRSSPDSIASTRYLCAASFT